ncbi:hypothetical protein PFISCL1PPCAC_15624 [Pristionchus fissidentatus]|uniref:tRNA (cytosine(38)-C(5))-methyltransferase n=1 Tax=Pristionchus fissidentatus TaxID=1538716 RepID=A0AAV5W2I7_9BILA|nr:hypothetical protein PFISCL1PPCAC_15624 [Pristionchus fissidentatus]
MDSKESEEKVRALEFYCGIGGTHFALKKLPTPICVIAAFDINTTTNAIYRHNFPSTKLCQNNIQGLTASALDKFHANLWTMSPPCQPFTLKGNLRGMDDRRCDSFKNLLTSLETMMSPPQWIFIENVSAFEGTSMHTLLIQTLNNVGYHIEEYMLSPSQFSVPNSRPRYYLLASRREKSATYISDIRRSMEECVEGATSSIMEYLEDNDEHVFLSRDKIEKAALSIVTPSSTSSACFTKSYTQYLVGCGSYLSDPNGIRPFSPREVASLMSFPHSFSWPSQVTHKQLYRALGNSVSVIVVSNLVSRLLTL